MEKAFKYRIYPNKRQKILIQKTFGCVRFIYNYYLSKKIDRYKSEKKSIGYNACCNDLTSLKKIFEWLKEVDATSLQKSLKDLDNAYKKFFNEYSGFPKFKSKRNRYKSYRTACNHDSIKFLGKHIQLPKLGYVKIRDKQILQGRILNATISQEPNGHYYCSLCCTDVEMEKLPKTHQNIGIDLGIVDFAVMSNEDRIANPRFFEKSEKKLGKLQRELSRKPNGSSNWKKARIRVTKLHKHIAEQRRDFLQKLTTDIIKRYDIICIEDLNVSELKEKKLNTSKESHVRHKHIGDVSWYEFRRQLQYKCKWYDKQLIVVNQYYPSSQICHYCNNQDGKKEESIRFWECPCCGKILDRDINAAINILNEGLQIA